jgi:hypothetical protein
LRLRPRHASCFISPYSLAKVERKREKEKCERGNICGCSKFKPGKRRENGVSTGVYFVLSYANMNNCLRNVTLEFSFILLLEVMDRRWTSSVDL